MRSSEANKYQGMTVTEFIMKILPKENHLQSKTEVQIEVMRELLENTDDRCEMIAHCSFNLHLSDDK